MSETQLEDLLTLVLPLPSIDDKEAKKARQDFLKDNNN